MGDNCKNDKAWLWSCRLIKCGAVGVGICLLGVLLDLKALQLAGSYLIMIPMLAWFAFLAVLAFYALKIIPAAIMEYGKEIAIAIAIIAALVLAFNCRSRDGGEHQTTVYNSY